MGALIDVGFLDQNGKITDSQRLEIIDEVVDAIRNASRVYLVGAELSLVSSPVPLAADTFAATNGLEDHKKRLPQWHSIYIDTFFNGVASMFDLIPTTGVAAKVIPIIDPTQPIIDILNDLKSLFPDVIDFDIIEFLQSILAPLFLKIPAFLADLGTLIQDFIDNVSDAVNDAIKKYISFIKTNVIDKINKPKRDIEAIKEEIDKKIEESQSFRTKILEAIKKIINSITSFPSIPTFDIKIPDFNFNISIPDITLPDLPSLPIFHISPPLPPGIAYFFLEFIKQLIAGIKLILTKVSDLISAIINGITSFISYIVQQIFNLVKEIIRALIPMIDKAITLAASMQVFCVKIAQMAVISILGWLVGPGIFINLAAKEVGLIS